MTATQLTPELLHILQHSLGVDAYGQGNQYRNRYITDPRSPNGKRCTELVDMGFMWDRGSQEIAGGMHCYHVTPEGIDAVALQSPVPPKTKKRSKEFDAWRRYVDACDNIPFSQFHREVWPNHRDNY